MIVLRALSSDDEMGMTCLWSAIGGIVDTHYDGLGRIETLVRYVGKVRRY